MTRSWSNQLFRLVLLCVFRSAMNSSWRSFKLAPFDIERSTSWKTFIIRLWKKIFHVLLLNKQNPLKVLSTLVAERSKKSKNVELIKLGNLSKWLKNSEENLFYQPSKRMVQFIQYFSVLLPDKNNCSFQFDHGNTDVDYKQFFLMVTRFFCLCRQLWTWTEP